MKMKTSSTAKRILSGLLLTFLCLPFASKASLSGTYTIDPASSASSTNYKTITSAISDISSGTRSDGGTANGAGVSSSVIFKIADGTYSAQYTIGSITGASSTNTITFQSSSSDSSKVILTYASSSSPGNNWLLSLNGA